MSFLSKLRPGAGREPSPDADVVTQSVPAHDKEAGEVFPNDSAKDDSDEAVPAQDAQFGVQKMEAITIAWSRKWLFTLLGLIWLLFLTNGFRLSILASLQPYVTSDFQQHSLTTVIGIVASAMSAAVYIPMAKMLDIWGRAEGFFVMVGCATLGLILMASSKNLATFCAAQVFYSVGFNGINYVVCVLAADATNLKNRGLAFAFTSSPYMITAFAGSKAAEAFLKNVNWRWGFGAFAIIVPFVTFPLFALLKYNLWKAEKKGLIAKRQKNTMSVFQTIWWAVIEFDLAGVILFAAGFTTFLLSFTLARSAPDGWKSGYIIAMIVVGFCILVFFVLFEVFVAPKPFMSGKFLLDRTVIGACMIDVTYQMSYSCWNSYFTSFLQVVNNLSVSEAGYVNSTFQVVSGVLLFIVGYGIRRTGRFRWLFYIAVPLYIFALGLMIHFRRPNGKIGYIVMCEIFISMGGAVFILCMQLAVLAAVDHQHVAAALATLFVCGSIGSAIGSTISGAIWTNTFSDALRRYASGTAIQEANIPLIVADLKTQLSFAVHTPERLAIQKAYGFAQTRMLAAGTGVMAMAFIWTFTMRNLDITKKQTKGTVL